MNSIGIKVYLGGLTAITIFLLYCSESHYNKIMKLEVINHVSKYCNQEKDKELSDKCKIARLEAQVKVMMSEINKQNEGKK
jgi:hypothetical protein